MPDNLGGSGNIGGSVAPSAPDIAVMYKLGAPFMPYSQGYWISCVFQPEGTGDFPLLEGVQNMARMLAGKLGLENGHHLLDIGCGGGGPAILWARTTGATVTGVTNIEQQVEQAAHAANDAGVADIVTFQFADAMNLPFAAETFDAAVMNGSPSHMADITAAMSEVFRVLRPGGRFALNDVQWRKPIADIASGIVDPLLRWLPGIRTLDGYATACREAGFDVDEAVDHTPRCQLTLPKYRQYFEGVLADHVADSDPTPRNLCTTTISFLDGAQHMVDEGTIGYATVVARKQAQ